MRVGEGRRPVMFLFCSPCQATPPAQARSVIHDVPHPGNGEEGPLGRAGPNRTEPRLPSPILSALGLAAISFLVPLMFFLES